LKVAIHQPNYLPYSGFFHKLSLVDTLVLMDNTQYDKKFTNRNKIIVPNGWIWISVPIKKEHKFSLNRMVEINNDIDWKENHLEKLQKSYANSNFFHLYENYFQKLYKKNWDFLFELNYEILKKIIELLGLNIKIIKESELEVQGKSTQRLVNICNSINADTYVSGIGGKDYIDTTLFEKNKINLEYQKFSHPDYPQHFSNSFIPNLSIIDALANLGPKTMKVLTNQSN